MCVVIIINDPTGTRIHKKINLYMLYVIVSIN